MTPLKVLDIGAWILFEICSLTFGTYDPLRQHFLDYPPVHIGQPEVAAVVAVG